MFNPQHHIGDIKNFCILAFLTVKTETAEASSKVPAHSHSPLARVAQCHYVTFRLPHGYRWEPLSGLILGASAMANKEARPPTPYSGCLTISDPSSSLLSSVSIWVSVSLFLVHLFLPACPLPGWLLTSSVLLLATRRHQGLGG